MMKSVSAAILAMGLVFSVEATASAQDADKGKSVFNQCKACHMLDKALIGPPLKGVIGRKAGSVAGFSYSPVMKAASDAGLVWNEAEIVDYLKNPTEYLKTYAASKGGQAATGSSKMTFMLANEDQRKNVVAYLAQQK